MGIEKNNPGKLHKIRSSSKGLKNKLLNIIGGAGIVLGALTVGNKEFKTGDYLSPESQIEKTVQKTREEVERVFLLILNDGNQRSIALIEQYPDGSIAADDPRKDIGRILSFKPVGITVDDDADVVYVGGNGTFIKGFSLATGENTHNFSTAPAWNTWELEVVGDEILATTRDNLTIINKHTGSATTVAVGENPLGIGIDKDRNIAGVVAQRDDAISIVDLGVKEVMGRIENLFRLPVDVMIKGDDIFVVGGGGNLTKINIAGFPDTDFSERIDITVGVAPDYIGFDANGNILVVNNRDNTGCTVSVVDPVTNTVTKCINLGETNWSEDPRGLEFTYNGRFANVPLRITEEVAVIDTSDYSVKKYSYERPAGQKITATAIDSWTTSLHGPPIACFNITNLEPYLAGEEIHFDASCTTEPDGHILVFEWVFGDGETIRIRNNPEVSHTYTIEGEEQNFTVTLTVTDIDGSDSATTTITVREDAGGTADSSDDSQSADSTDKTGGTSETDTGGETGGSGTEADTGGTSEETDTTDLPTPGDSSTAEHTDFTHSTESTDGTGLPEGAYGSYECRNTGNGPVYFGDGYENTLVGWDKCDILQIDDSSIKLTPGQVLALLRYLIDGEETFIYGTDLRSRIWLKHNNPKTKVIIIPIDDNNLDISDFGINELGVTTLGTYFEKGGGYPPGLATRLNPDNLPEEKTIFIKVVKDPERAKDEINAIEIVNMENNELTKFKHLMFVYEGYTILINLETRDYELYDEYNKFVEGGTLGEGSDGETTGTTEGTEGESGEKSDWTDLNHADEGCGGGNGCGAVRSETKNKYPSPAALAWLFTIFALLRKKGFVDRNSEEGQARMEFWKRLKEIMR